MKCVNEMPVPQHRDDLQRFLGMVTYMGGINPKSQPVVVNLTGYLKEVLCRIWCGVNRLGDSGVNRLGDTSAFVNTFGDQLLLTRRGKTRMDGVGIVFEFYTAPL